jgi:hypothetical protein
MWCVEVDQAKFLYNTSFLCLLSTGYAIYRGHYDLACVPSAVFITSINYWRKPDYSWRRYVDMMVVQGALGYQLVRAYRVKHGEWYYATIAASAGFYALGTRWHQSESKPWSSVYAHSLLHLSANLGNIILYSIL